MTYGKGPSLECDPARTPSPPLNGSDYGPVRAYVSSPVDPVRFSDNDHLEDEAPPDERYADPSQRSESIQDALARLARFSGAVKTTTSLGKSSRSTLQRALGRHNQTRSHTHTLSESGLIPDVLSEIEQVLRCGRIDGCVDVPTPGAVPLFPRCAQPPCVHASTRMITYAR